MFKAGFFRGAVCSALGMVILLGSLPACSSSSDSASDDALLAGIVREGSGSDAAMRSFLSREPDDWAWAGGVFDQPVHDGDLPGGAPFTFTWHADNPDADETESAGAGSRANTAAPGFTGVLFLLVFSTPSNPKLLRVFTSNTRYTPGAAAWKTLSATHEPITLALSSGTFEANALAEDGGPHNGQVLSLTIGAE